MKTLLVLIIFLLGSAVYGESPLVDPRIPHGESLRYRIIKGDEISYSTQEIFQESDGSGRIYSVFTKSETQESNLLLNSSGLVPFKSSVINRSNGAEYSSETVIQKMPGFLKIIGGLFPKTYFWYSVERPNLLIRYEGSAEFGGDKQTIELVDSSW